LAQRRLSAGRHRGARPVGLLLAAACWLPHAAAAGIERADEGAWSSAIPSDPAASCELTTGGYDHAADEQQPLLLIAIERADPASPLRVIVMTDTDLTQGELLQARAWLHVEGSRASSLRLLPAAIVESVHERRVTFRPRFGGDEQAGLHELVEAMQRADSIRVEINGRALEPAFSMHGLSALWQRAAQRCGLRP
jgi:hypothetical protein